MYPRIYKTLNSIGVIFYRKIYAGKCEKLGKFEEKKMCSGKEGPSISVLISAFAYILPRGLLQALRLVGHFI